MSNVLPGNGSRRDADDTVSAVLAQVRELLDGVRFGSITLVVQDGVVVQIDRTEKRRLQPSARWLERPSQVEVTADLAAQLKTPPTVRIPRKYPPTLGRKQ
jgi:hypothetical protein